MKPFHTVAIPHQDIIEGRLTMDIFAADLWETAKSRGPDDYRDPEIFFEKTYLTNGLNNILNIVEKRLKGNGGDPVIQIQTPFGGGKTHSLIAMFHKSKEWMANTVVIVGTTLNANTTTIWGEMAKQLGSSKFQDSLISPGRDEIRNLLISKQPVLILIDELLVFMTKASGISVGDSNLASQTLAFIQELSEAAAITEKSCLVATLPSSDLEHMGMESEKYFQQLQKIFGRVEKIYTPVQDNEIANVIRKRLFSSVDEVTAKKIVSEFIKYADKEGILPTGREKSEYRDEFLASYPFTPEVVDILYKRWGSYPKFQRTRGVLRILALVIHSLRNSDCSYISIADFNLANDEIKRELINNIGQEFSGIIASDITSPESGAKKVDNILGRSYSGLMLGTRTTTTIFMCSFSGGTEKGLSISDLKRYATTMDNPASVIAEAAEKLKGSLYFLQTHQDKFFFSNEPNLNRILLTKMENTGHDEIREREMQLLKRSISGRTLKIVIWPETPGDIPDNRELKLVILREKDIDMIKKIIETKGESPRVYRNTLLFLCPFEQERNRFIETLKRSLAYEYISSDKTLSLKDEQHREVSRQIKHMEEDIREVLFGYYRVMIVPSKDSPKEINLGVPTYGDKNDLDQRVFSLLRQEGEIIEKVSSIRIRDRFLRDKEYIKIGQIYESILKTPGEIRIKSFDALELGIKEGLKTSEFAIGTIEENGRIHCIKGKETMIIDQDTLLVHPDKSQQEPERIDVDSGDGPAISKPPSNPPPHVVSSMGRSDNQDISSLGIRIELPHGKVSGLMGVMNLLQLKFENMELEIRVYGGSITDKEFEEMIKEAFNQLGISYKVISKG